MAENGILAQDAAREDYRLGPLLRSAAALAAAVSNLPAIARPHMERLRDECQETVVLAELHDVFVVPVLRADGLHEMRMNQEVGRRYPAHAGATAKVLIAHLAGGGARGAGRAARARGADRASRSPIASGSSADLEAIAEIGAAVTIGERVPEAVAIAAPVFDARGRVAASLTISGIASRYEPRRLVTDAIAARRAAAAISADLGSPGVADPAGGDVGDAGSSARGELEAMCERAWEGQRART